jgi:hypothetical protein
MVWHEPLRHCIAPQFMKNSYLARRRAIRGGVDCGVKGSNVFMAQAQFYRLAGVMGYPVMHSRSPLLHNSWMAEHGVTGHYMPLSVRPDNLQQALRALPALGFSGANLTIPHKEAALAIVDRVDELALRIGAVDCVCVAPKLPKLKLKLR